MAENSTPKVALISGASKRIGQQIARQLHRHNFNILVHYQHSKTEAKALAAELNQLRKNSCDIYQADITQIQTLKPLIKHTAECWGRLDLVINNASSFYPTPLTDSTQAEWDNLIGTNLKAPYFLSQAAVPHLQKSHGSIINIVDIYGIQPLANHSIYSIAKAGLVMMTKALATDLAPHIRVNGIAPGAIIWPENNSLEDTSDNSSDKISEAKQQQIIQTTALKRQGCAEDIAHAVDFLAMDADYVTGQIIKVDGGRI